MNHQLPLIRIPSLTALYIGGLSCVVASALALHALGDMLSCAITPGINIPPYKMSYEGFSYLPNYSTDYKTILWRDIKSIAKDNCERDEDVIVFSIRTINNELYIFQHIDDLDTKPFFKAIEYFLDKSILEKNSALLQNS